MTTFIYEQRMMTLGDTLRLNEGDILSGSHIEPDTKRGGFHIVAHLLRRQGEEVEMSMRKELPA